MNNKKETLLILTPGFPENENDSTCIPPQQVFVRSLARQFPDLSIRVLSFQYPFLKKDYYWEGIPVASFGGRHRTKLYRLVLWIKIYRRLRQLYRDQHIIGILSFWHGECSLVAKVFAARLGIRHFSWILGQDAKKDNPYVKWARLQPGELLALSDFVQDEFHKNHGVRPQHVLPPGIDKRLFEEASGKREIDILAAGSLIPLKQYPVLVEITAALKKYYPGIKVVLAGKGPQQPVLEQMIAGLGLQDNITMTGELPHPDLLKLMQRSRVFLHPSLYEGFGVVCLEALYAGASVISFCKPMKEEIKNWHTASSKESMARKALELLQTLRQHDSVCPYTMEETVYKMVGLFKTDSISTTTPQPPLTIEASLP